MSRLCTFVLVFGLLSPNLTAALGAGDEGPVTWTGWVSDLNCAAPRVAKGEIGPNNPECVKKCLDKGIEPVFVSEQAKALFKVEDYPSAKDDVGYHIELTGVVDQDGGTIAVHSVKRLSYTGAMCALPKKPRGSI